MRRDEPFVSVVVPCYNEEQNIKKCIDSILACGYEKSEIVVVDDSSTNGTRNVLESYADRGLIKYVHRIERGGTIKAINTGARVASGSVIAVVPGDSYVEKDWIEKAVDHFCRDRSVMAVGGPLKSARRGYWERCGESLDELLLNSGLEVASLPGANMFIKSNVLSALGFFDESLVVGEDFDLNIRLKEFSKRNAGRIVVDDELRVYTSYPRSLVEEARRRFRWGIGRSRVLLKNRKMSMKAWMRSLYAPILFSLSFLLVVSAEIANSIQQAVLLMLILALLLPALIPVSTLIFDSECMMRIRVSGYEIFGIVLLACTRLVFGSLGSMWGLIRVRSAK